MLGKVSTFFVILISILLINYNLASAVVSEKDNSKISVVVIDPGHGGKDPGAKIGKAQEKDIVLNIALKLGEIIKQNYPEIKVVYTRTTDVFIPLYKRADIANKSKADLFVSIHVNAVDARSVQGTETFVLGLHRNDLSAFSIFINRPFLKATTVDSGNFIRIELCISSISE